MCRGIVTAFGAAGFTSWTILHTKEMLISLADSIRRRTDEWVEKKKQEGLEEGRAEGRKEGRAEGRKEARAELLREFRQARDEGRLDELLDCYAYQLGESETQHLENRG